MKITLNIPKIEKYYIAIKDIERAITLICPEAVVKDDYETPDHKTYEPLDHETKDVYKPFGDASNEILYGVSYMNVQQYSVIAHAEKFNAVAINGRWINEETHPSWVFGYSWAIPKKYELLEIDEESYNSLCKKRNSCLGEMEGKNTSWTEYTEALYKVIEKFSTVEEA